MKNLLTAASIGDMLKARKGMRTLAQLAEEIERHTKHAVSVSHLSNVMAGRKSPGTAVSRYLGIEKQPPPQPVYILKADKRK